MKKYFFILTLILSLNSNAQTPAFPKNPPVLKLSDPMPTNLFVELAKAVNPTVVNISTSAVLRGQMGARDPMMELFEQFYGLRQQQRPRSSKPQPVGLGTGFIIREDGLILTNNHVVAGADVVNVQLSEKSDKTYEAKVIGTDQRTDIALIKIKADVKLPVAVLGNSKDIQVGQWVAAFGNPFGHGHTMTKGIISSIGREIGEINKIPLLQTDASINPGNSGGPLVDSKGMVIGVNSAIDARAQGIGFAIPIDEVKKIIPDLESRGSIRKGYLGIQLGDLDPSAAEYLGIPENTGTVVAGLEKGGTAYKAGLRPYDIITEFNGRKIRNTVDLMDAVGDAPIGSKAKVKALRERKAMTFDVIISERPNVIGKKELPPAPKVEGQKAPNDLGFSMTDLTPTLRQQYEYPSDLKRPIIVNVQNGSLAELAGLQEGDIILDVNKSEVTNAKEAMSKIKKGSNSLRVARGSRVFVITMTGA